MLGTSSILFIKAGDAVGGDSIGSDMEIVERLGL